MDTTINSLRARLKAHRLPLLLVAAGMAPLLGVFLVALWNRETYQFFPFALIGVGMLAWRAVGQLGDQPPAAGGRWLTWLLALVAGLVFLAANYVWSPWLGFVAFLIALLAGLWWLGGWSLVRLLGPAWLMLLAILPPPLGWDQTLTLQLRSVAVNNSSALLDWLRVIHVQQGNILSLPGKSLMVEEACSGINSFFLCNAFCLFWLLWQRRSLVWLPVVMLFTTLFVVLGNIIRITLGAAGYYYWQLNLLSGWQHETFGLILVLIYCGLILSVDQFWGFFNRPLAPTAAAPSARILPPTVSRSGSGLGFRLVGIFLALVGLGFSAVHIYKSRGEKISSFARLNRQEIKLSLPASLAGWQRLNSGAGNEGFVKTFGVHSLTWQFQRDGVQATVAVDYPLDGFHNVRVCYSGSGWETMGEDQLFAPQGHTDLHAIKLTLRQSIRHAVVYHSVVDQNGGWLSDPKVVVSRLAQTLPSAVQTGYRVQLFQAGYAPLSAAAAPATEALFFQARQTLVQQIMAQLHPSRLK